jgi:predicted Zn-dependent protease
LLQDLAAKVSNIPKERRERFTAFLAAVLAHEIAHITLGHTDSLLATVTRLASEAGVPDSALGDPLSYRSVARDTAVTLEMLQHSRERELAADRVGGLYLLRAGWTIQTAMDLFRALDSLERKDPSFYESLTYVRTHPRASTREAGLEAFRAQLKSLQADYDDALTLIRSNVAVETAVTLLDTVLVYFPEMLPALHARGTAYHQLWLETVPVPMQQARASLTTYAFRFLPMVRGLPGNLSLYAAARNDYMAVLAHEPLGLTAVQLALLEAYAGDCPQASRRSHEAVASDSLSPAVANNRGVVLLVCNRPAEALQAFERAQRLTGAQSLPAFLFNTARAMKEAGDPHAASLFKEYLTVDPSSEWAAEARRQLGVASANEPVGEPAPRAKDSPRIQGIELGYSIAQVRTAWGAPASVSGDTLALLTYPARGVDVLVSPTRGVALISLLTREAGAIQGIRVGDRVAAARATWGTPVEQREDDLLFDRGAWTVAVRQRGEQIATLLVFVND